MILSCTSFINKILCQTNRSAVKLIICNHFYLLMSVLVFSYIHLFAIGEEISLCFCYSVASIGSLHTAKEFLPKVYFM